MWLDQDGRRLFEAKNERGRLRRERKNQGAAEDGVGESEEVGEAMGLIVTVSICARRAFCTFEKMATAAITRRMNAINHKPLRGAGDDGGASSEFMRGISTARFRPQQMQANQSPNES